MPEILEDERERLIRTARNVMESIEKEEWGLAYLAADLLASFLEDVNPGTAQAVRQMALVEFMDERFRVCAKGSFGQLLTLFEKETFEEIKNLGYLRKAQLYRGVN